jgi:hypothetical protein
MCQGQREQQRAAAAAAAATEARHSSRSVHDLPVRLLPIGLTICLAVHAFMALQYVDCSKIVYGLQTNAALSSNSG